MCYNYLAAPDKLKKKYGWFFMNANDKKIIDESQKWLDIISTKKISDPTARRIVSETLENFESYYNKGFLEYRKVKISQIHFLQ